MDGKTCADGTVQENNAQDYAKLPAKKTVRVKRKTELDGCGVPGKIKKPLPSRDERAAGLAPNLPPEDLENHGELLFLLFDRIDRVAARQDRKFDRIQLRLDELEAWRRSG